MTSDERQVTSGSASTPLSIQKVAVTAAEVRNEEQVIMKK